MPAKPYLGTADCNDNLSSLLFDFPFYLQPTPRQNPFPSARAHFDLNKPTSFGRFGGAFGYNQPSCLLTRDGGMSLVLFTQATNQPKATGPCLRTSRGREEQLISEHKVSENAIELSSGCAQDRFRHGQKASAIVGESKERPHPRLT